MAKKLFCEYNWLTYRISVWKRILLRKRHWHKMDRLFAKTRNSSPLPVKIYEHRSLIHRKLGNVDSTLQNNKATNLAIAKEKINGIIIAPGEIFSFWYLVGTCTSKKGYKTGLIIKNGAPDQAIGGGMCQFTNLIHWLVLHSPLTIIEHHHHNQYDLFPDYGRQLPFGTGTSIFYNYLDYQIVNNTCQHFQFLFGVDEKYLTGELRSDQEIDHAYHIREENHFFTLQDGCCFRNNEIYRETLLKKTGASVSKELLSVNHSKVMYDLEFVPHHLIRS